MEPVFWATVALACYLLYKLGTAGHDVWRRKNVPFLRPVPFLGNFWPLVFKLKSDTESMKFLYRLGDALLCLLYCNLNFRLGGIWLFQQPSLMIRDPDLMKKVTIKDFDHFMNRNTILDDDLDPIFAKNLMMRHINTDDVAILPDQKWKNMRNILTPMFTSAKMKNMFHLVNQCGRNRVDKITLDGDDLTGQVVLFLFAGFDTTSTFLSFTAYELALNREVQTRLQEEIDKVLEEDDGKITFEGISSKMVYLNMVVNECLRKWPPVNAVDRLVSRRYVIPAEGNEPEVLLEKGALLPIQGLHNDPRYFPDPEKFDPERFSEENTGKIFPFSFIPFGSGPRNCIGMRFALMEGKVCLVNLLKKLTVEVVPETRIPLRPKKASVVKTGEKGIWLGLKRRFSDG